MSVQINPKAIKAQMVQGKKGMVGPPSTTGGGFGTAMNSAFGATSAAGPAMYEFMWQGGASDTALTVLNAAFSGMNALQQPGGGMAMTGMGMGGMGGMGSAGTVPGMMGTGRYSTTGGFMDGAKGQFGVQDPNATNIDDPASYQYELMQTMNSNNLKLLELQALMQSNMQSWTTKSNILSADHRARMAMIEKFSARG